MDKLRIQGGHRLVGEIAISGAKNAALPILCACLLTADPVHLHNVPNLQDVRSMLALLGHMGVHIDLIANTPRATGQTVTLQAQKLLELTAPYDCVKAMRASILVLGPLLARFGAARVSLPGGCAIGSRPVDQHIKGLCALGANIHIEHGYIEAHIPDTSLVGANMYSTLTGSAKPMRLKGHRFIPDMITVTGTENILMAATLAEGETVIENAAQEPEVTDLARFLVAMGARIEGIGTDCLVIQGVERLHGAVYTIAPDRIEAGTFLCAVAATGGELTLRHVDPTSLDVILGKLREAGLILEVGADTIHAVMRDRPRAVSFKTSEYPAFPTDLQAQFMALNCVAEGQAYVKETIFENRFMHVGELIRLGASIGIEGNMAWITGTPFLLGANVMATDLRASAGLVIAALAAQGETIIDHIYHLDRGYDEMEKKLCAVGALVERIGSMPPLSLLKTPQVMHDEVVYA
ncbi:hypothetical protein BGX27_001132 [Mortierella sp. AM989]|nr:hypothetical protein BGX27_001132 [Mortierella sp. AM989]